MNSSTAARAAIYLRVSSERQHAENQEHAVRGLLAARGFHVEERHIFRATEKGDAKRNDVKAACLAAAHRGEFQTLGIFALDRWSRCGIAPLLNDIAQLRSWGVSIVSAMEPWADTSPGGAGELMLAIAAWMARQEKQRLSERNRATAARLRSDLAAKGKLISKRGFIFTGLGRRRIQVTEAAVKLARELRAKPGNRYAAKPMGWPAIAAEVSRTMGENYSAATLGRAAEASV